MQTISSRRFGATVRELAEELGVTERTIRRDLDLFRGVGFPLEETAGERGRKTWRLQGPAFSGHAASGTLSGPSPGAAPPGLSFAFDEALALYLGRRFLDPLAGTILWEAAQSAFKKVRACLGRPALDYLDKMAGNLHHASAGGGDYAAKRDLIDQLLRGIEDCKATHIVYRSLRATEPVTYEVYPYGMTYHKGSLYLVAGSREHDDVRSFKIDRMDEAEVGPFPFQRPDGFDLRAYFAKSFGVFHGRGDVQVRIRFSPSVARYVEENRWHESQALTKQRDGSVVAEFRLSGTEEIKHWIQSFGPLAEVLAPDSLRAEIIADLRQALTTYEQAAPRKQQAKKRSFNPKPQAQARRTGDG